MRQKKEIISNERNTGDLQGISSVLGNIAKRMLGKKAFVEADIICNWANIVGDEMADFLIPVNISFKKGERSDGVLTIAAAGGAFALEVQLKNKLLIDKVNTFFGYRAVSSIKIIQDPNIALKKNDDIPNIEKKLVTKEEENYIKSLSENVKNTELSLALQRLGEAIVVNNKK